MHERATPELPVDVQMLPLAFSQLRAAVLLGALATIRTGLTARIGDTRGRTVARRLAGSSLCHRVIALAQQQSNVEWCSAAGSHEAQPHPPTMMREASRSAALLMRRTIFTACRRSVRWMGSATCVRGRLTGWEHAWLGDSGHSARSASARGAEIDLHSVTLPCRLFAMGAREWPCATLPRISGVLGRGMRIFTRFFSAVSDAGMRWDNGTPASPARPTRQSGATTSTRATHLACMQSSFWLVHLRIARLPRCLPPCAFRQRTHVCHSCPALALLQYFRVSLATAPKSV